MGFAVLVGMTRSESTSELGGYGCGGGPSFCEALPLLVSFLTSFFFFFFSVTRKYEEEEEEEMLVAIFKSKTALILFCVDVLGNKSVLKC